MDNYPDKINKGRKFCTNCNYHDLDHTGAICKHLEAEAVDFVSGTPYSRSCFTMRGEAMPCGPIGKLYEEL